MKKISLIIAAGFLMSTVAFAQSAPAKTEQSGPKKEHRHHGHHHGHHGHHGMHK